MTSTGAGPARGPFRSHRVREEVEVDRLAVALAKTLERTMQPASASIWKS